MNRLVLVRPTEAHINEIRAFKEEFLAHDSHTHSTSGLGRFDNIQEWLAFVRTRNNAGTLPPDSKYVSADQYILMREGEPRILGMINFRHSLGAEGGHLAEHGLSRVLLTCADDNEKSRKTIIACGGVFERLAITGDERDERYWIAL
ncbi:MAG: hypothetical protein FWC16_14700 [Defluviitaleaceae bacterium]|nr:hypothetical protein [Defluviitaleaceae bacterium]MCL2276164.1 hypothetical protein [Defluviitaleaceae bacterium]